MKEKIDSIQALRGIGFISVFLYHAGVVRSGGGYGVSLFIVLSGFLLIVRHDDKLAFKPSIFESFQFSLRKIRKLCPLHVLMTIAAVPLVYEQYFNSNTRSGLGIFVFRFSLNILLIHTWFPWVDIRYSFNVSSWFLSCMMFLWFMFPWIRNRIIRMRTTWQTISSFIVIILSMILWAILISILIPQNDNQGLVYGLTYNSPIWRLGEFSIGCLTGKCYLNNRGKHIPQHVTLLEIGILLISIFTIVSNWDRLNSGSYWWPKCLIYLFVSCLTVYVFAIHRGVLQFG